MSALVHPEAAFGGDPGGVEVSFEFFPPKSPAAAAGLWSTVSALERLAPRFVSVTSGAGGTTLDGTRDTVARIRRETALEPAAHLTCVGASRSEVDRIAAGYWDIGVRHIVALRGDAAPGAAYRPHPDGYENAAALVAGLKRVAPFEISIAAYPEGHPESANRAADLDNLWRKIDAGADRAITQFFFSADCFLRFRDQAAALGIEAEIVPGILPIGHFAQARAFAETCGASVPEWLQQLFEGLDEHPDTRALVSAAVAADLCARLHAGGVRQFHFFTLNKAELSSAVCHLLGLRAREPVRERARAA
jgi:methylenetetrahydrofolate reductase (NADPH)